MGTNITLETVLVHFMVFECLRPVEVAVTVAAAEPLDITVRQQVSFKLVGPRKLAHAA